MNIANCAFHHIGYTVEDIEASAKEFEQWGYTVSETVHDEALTVDLCYQKPVHQTSNWCISTTLHHLRPICSGRTVSVPITWDS